LLEVLEENANGIDVWIKYYKSNIFICIAQTVKIIRILNDQRSDLLSS
jgi:hypothetical protein